MAGFESPSMVQDNTVATNIELVEGGNIIRQGHHLTLGYIAYDELGQVVDLSDKTVDVVIWGRKGIAYEGDAVFEDGVLRFTLDQAIPSGDYNVEFTATLSTDAGYRKKYPTNTNTGRISVKQSADDLGAVGISVFTIDKFEKRQKELQDAYHLSVDSKVETLEADFEQAVGALTVDSEVVLARGEASTLRARLDAEKAATTQQLAETASKAELSAKRDKTQLIELSDAAPSLQQALTGNAPVANNVPLNESVTLNTFDKNIRRDFISLNDSFEKEVLSRNLYDKNLAQDNKYLNTATNGLSNATTFAYSGVMPAEALTTYNASLLSEVFHFIFFWNGATLLSYITTSGDKNTHSFTTPNGTDGVSVNIKMPADHTPSTFQSVIGGLQIEKGSVKTTYQEYAYNLKLVAQSNPLTEVVENYDEFLYGYLTEEKMGKNRYNSVTAIDGQYYSTTSGNPNPIATAAITGKFEVIPEVQQTLSIDKEGSRTFHPFLYYWRADGSLIGSNINAVWSAGKSVTFTPPADAKYAGATFLWQVTHDTAEFNTAKNLIQLELGGLATAFEPYKVTRVLSNEVSKTAGTSRYEGKKIMMFGDSITQGTMGGYVPYVQSITKATIENKGSSGAATGRLLAIMTSVKDRSDTTITATPDYSNVAAVTIQIGTNGVLTGSLADIPYGKDIRVDKLPVTYNGITATTEAEYWALFANNHFGNLAICIEYVKWKNPKTKIFLITPPLSGDTTKAANVRIATLSIAERYSVDVIDAQLKAGIDIKYLDKYSYDGTHFNELGNELWGTYNGYQILNN